LGTRASGTRVIPYTICCGTTSSVPRVMPTSCSGEVFTLVGKPRALGVFPYYPALRTPSLPTGVFTLLSSAPPLPTPPEYLLQQLFSLRPVPMFQELTPPQSRGGIAPQPGSPMGG